MMDWTKFARSCTVVVGICSLAGCGESGKTGDDPNVLTREAAVELLRQPVFAEGTIRMIQVQDAALQKLIDDGLLGLGTFAWCGVAECADVTSRSPLFTSTEGRYYRRGGSSKVHLTLATGIRPEGLSVTGIREEPFGAGWVLEYTYRLGAPEWLQSVPEEYPLAKRIGQYAKPGQIVNGSALAIRYDDGWRLSR